MDKHEIHRVVETLGYKGDRYGNMVSPTGKTRLKFQATSLRVEQAYRPSPSDWDPKPKKQWLNRVSDYYCNIRPSDNGSIVIKGRRLLSLA